MPSVEIHAVPAEYGRTSLEQLVLGWNPPQQPHSSSVAQPTACEQYDVSTSYPKHFK
jgi:hypothetical protein